MEETSEKEQREEQSSHRLITFVATVATILLIGWSLYEDSTLRWQQIVSRYNNAAMLSVIEKSSADRFIEDYRKELQARTDLHVQAAVKVSPQRTDRTFKGIVCSLESGKTAIRRVSYHHGSFHYPVIEHADPIFFDEISSICATALGAVPGNGQP